MENKKYYTPDLSELYLGYECEQTYDLEEYVPYIIDYKHGHLDFPQSTEYIRTKYLDSDDIISLDFEKLNVTPILKYRTGFVNKDLNLILALSTHNKVPFIEIRLYDPIKYEKMNNPEHFKVSLPCKSKNELKTILSWINQE